MGTFHPDTHPLHGITVVVDTTGPEVWVGRCDDASDARIVLLDADVHRDGDGGRSKEEFVRRVAQVGFWKRHDRVVVPSSDVVSVRRLGDIS